MPSTKEVPEVGTIYLYEDVGTAKSRARRNPFFNFFRKKLNLDSEEIEGKRQAIMKKDGHYRVRYTGLNGYRRKYLSDFYITLVDLKWRYALAVFFNMYLFSFFIFGVFWWICAYNHGDFQNVNTPGWEPCISSVYSFIIYHFVFRYTGLNGYRRKYLSDFYITLVDLKWRYALAVFFNMYLFSFFIFGVFWWICAYNHGDFQNVNTPGWEPCISSVYSFPKCLLFSIETQTTIGYGVAYPNTDCDGTLFLVYLQITIGILLDNILLGFIFVKFAQPKKRQNTIIFSKNACVTHHDGELAIQVRVGDMRKSHMLAATVHGVIIRRHVTVEGVLYPIYMTRVAFTADKMDDTVVLMWPMILTHKITKESPLWDIKPTDLTNENYELILFIEGTIESTGEFCQVRTSYTPRELLWGHRFDRIEEFDSGNARWEIDFASFNDVVYTSNIRHSAKELASFRSAPALPEYDDGETEKTEKKKKKDGVIRTSSMKTVSYDTRPQMPPPKYNFDRRSIKFDMPKNESEAGVTDIDAVEDTDTATEGAESKRGSVASFDERDYQTADESREIW